MGEKNAILLWTERNRVHSRVGQCHLALNWILALVAQTSMAVQSNKAARWSIYCNDALTAYFRLQILLTTS